METEVITTIPHRCRPSSLEREKIAGKWNTVDHVIAPLVTLVGPEVSLMSKCRWAIGCLILLLGGCRTPSLQSIDQTVADYTSRRFDVAPVVPAKPESSPTKPAAPTKPTSSRNSTRSRTEFPCTEGHEKRGSDRAPQSCSGNSGRWGGGVRRSARFFRGDFGICPGGGRE